MKNRRLDIGDEVSRVVVFAEISEVKLDAETGRTWNTVQASEIDLLNGFGTIGSVYRAQICGLQF